VTPIIALRHLPVRGAAGLCYGQHDWPADPEDIVAALPEIRAQLPPWPILSSPLQRCLRLAERLHTPQQGPLQVDERLKEMHFGDWEMRRWTQIERAHLDQWSANVVAFAPPGGESFASLIERVAAVVDGLGEPSILVTHAGVIRALWHVVGGWPAAKAAAEPVPYGRALRIRWSPQAWRRA
jgi:alpha-ribazole phosphatase